MRHRAAVISASEDGMQQAAATLRSPVLRSQRRGPYRALQRLLRDKVILASLLLLALVATCGTVPGVLAPLDPHDQSLRHRLKPPLAESPEGRYWLGTDSLGRDVLSRVVFGARVSMLVAVSSVLLAGSIGVTLGLVSGYFRGWIDDVIGWLTNVQLSFPFILIAVTVVAVLGPGLRNLILVLGVTTWVVYGRVVRGEVLAARSRDYVEAARVLGAGNIRILVRHILPNIVTPLIIITTFEVARIIIAEAALSFLGLGAGGSAISWGTMMADGRKDLATSWWIATMPGIAIMLTVLAINLLGDWVRDELDPRVTKA
ncbi:MAG: ABC transporter permease [Chloroflexota bacterium]|nr:ABC transporter permease [Chloroflexota bacterium]